MFKDKPFYNFIICKRGFTLVELLVGLALLSTVLVLGYSFFFFGYNAFSLGEQRFDVRQNIRLAADFITQELRYATHVRVLSSIPAEGSFAPDYKYIYVKDELLKYRTAGSSEETLFSSKADGVMLDDLSFKLDGIFLEYTVKHKYAGGDDYGIASKLKFLNYPLVEAQGETGVAIAYKSESPLRHALTIQVSGQGTTTPAAGIYFYESGTGVNLSAAASWGWKFKEWLVTEMPAVAENQLNITMDRDRTATAVFEEIPVGDERTALPYIEYLQEGDITISGTAEPNSIIKITVTRNGITYQPLEGQSADTGIYTVAIPDTYFSGSNVLRTNDLITVTARVPGKLESLEAFRTVRALTEPDEGLVLIVDNEGNTEYLGFQNNIDGGNNRIIITSGVGDIVTNENINIYNAESILIQSGVTFTTTANHNEILLESYNDIELQGEVVFSNTSNGHNSVSLTSLNGDVILRDTVITSSGNANIPEQIAITAHGDVDISGARITANRTITITAGKNIFAMSGFLSVGKNNENINIALAEGSSGKIKVQGLRLEYGKSTVTVTPLESLCGILHPESDPIPNYSPIECP